MPGLLKGGRTNPPNATPRSVSAESIGGQTPPVPGSPKVERREAQGINLLPGVVSFVFLFSISLIFCLPEWIKQELFCPES